MAKEQMTPMMTQYLKTKEEYEDCILFYRLGDFYAAAHVAPPVYANRLRTLKPLKVL